MLKNKKKTLLTRAWQVSAHQMLCCFRTTRASDFKVDKLVWCGWIRLKGLSLPHWTMLHSNLQFDSSRLFFPFLFSLNFRFSEFQTTLQFEFLYRFDSYCFDYFSFNLKWFIDFELIFNFIFLCFFFGLIFGLHFFVFIYFILDIFLNWFFLTISSFYNIFLVWFDPLLFFIFFVWEIF